MVNKELSIAVYRQTGFYRTLASYVLVTIIASNYYSAEKFDGHV